MLVVLCHDRLKLGVPHEHRLVIATRGNQPRIGGKGTNAYPVLVTSQTKLELLLFRSEDL